MEDPVENDPTTLAIRTANDRSKNPVVKASPAPKVLSYSSPPFEHSPGQNEASRLRNRRRLKIAAAVLIGAFAIYVAWAATATSRKKSKVAGWLSQMPPSANSALVLKTLRDHGIKDIGGYPPSADCVNRRISACIYMDDSDDVLEIWIEINSQDQLARWYISTAHRGL